MEYPGFRHKVHRLPFRWHNDEPVADYSWQRAAAALNRVPPSSVAHIALRYHFCAILFLKLLKDLMDKLGGIFITSFFIAFSGALMPGPLLSATISESGRKGWKVGPLYMLGHGVLEALLIGALFLGLAPLLVSDTAFVIVAFAGGLFMIWMAWGMFRSLPSLTLTGTGGRAGGSLPLTGALLSLANPYWIIWWATIGMGYVLIAGKLGFSGVLAFFLGHILADLGWYAFVSLAIHKGRNILPDRVYRGIIAICALFLLGYAAYLLYNGIVRLI
jgi:threonine/homoserine/homoserine lactone efflux protein